MKKFEMLFALILVLILLSQNSYSLQSNKTQSKNSLRLTKKNSLEHVSSTSFSKTEFVSSQSTFDYFTFSRLDIETYYDLQSNAVPNQIWQDPLNPDNVHAVFMYSPDSSLSIRKCAYFFSNDKGQIWNNLGDIPPTGQNGFPSISGFTNGSVNIANNFNSGANSRTKVYYDAGPGFGVFTELDPGSSPAGLYPRVVGIGNNKIAFVTYNYTNTITNISPPGTFSGYDPYNTDGPETYWISIAPNGRLGHAYVGAANGTNDYDVFYRYSDVDGLTWSNPLKIWDWNLAADSLGCLRGVSMVFDRNSEPHIAFNISKLTETGFFPELPSSIRVWSPSVNSGVPVIVADQNNVPFYPNKGNTSDAFLPICRPSIGRGSASSGLFIAFPATTGYYGSDSSSYFALWFSGSINNGSNWLSPEKFTPESPLIDWRYVSISQVNHSTNSKLYVQMIAQADTFPGSFVNGSPVGIARAIGIRYVNEVGISNISYSVPDQYSLAQNFPNPFNPETKIRFDIKENSKVSLKVYDMKGALVSVLADKVNVTPGTKEVSFTANGLSSGVYLYTLTADNFSETKKMILVR